MTAPPAPSRGRWIAGAAGCLLLAAYVVPLYVPPPAGPPATVGPETDLWTRLFPHTPLWTALRLVALAAGAVLLSWAGRDASIATPAPPRGTAGEPRRTPRVVWCERAALVVAALLALAATQAWQLSRWSQLGLLLALGLPALLLWAAERGESTAPAPASGSDRRWWAAIALLLVVWVGWRVVLARHDPRAADMVDMWKNFTFFLHAANRPANVVTQTYEVGVSSVYLLSIGLPFVSSGLAEPTFAWIQAFHAAWIVATAVGVAALARRLAGPPAMVPAVAALLFSPFMLSMALCVAPFAFMTTLAVFLPVLALRIYERQTRADVAALGALAGLAATFPHLTLWAAAVSLAVTPWMLRRRPPPIVWATAILCGLASVIPVLPSLLDLSAMAETYVERLGAAMELEQLVMGQKHYTHREVAALWQAGIRGALDIPIAALLQPFAILRTPLRLSGDVYFEPVAAALAAVGLAACVAQARRSRAALLLCVTFALGLVPAVTSAADRASLTRNLVLPVALPLFTLVGVAVTRRALRLRLPPARLELLLGAIIAASGIVLFDRINPRIVPTTWLGLGLQALADTPADEVLLFEPGNPPNDWLHVAEIGRYLPRQPLATRAYVDGGSLLASADGDAPAGGLLLWSPGLEELAGVRQSLCQCWPRAVLYTLRDRAARSRAFAARPSGAEWTPALGREQWSAEPCADEPQAARCEPLRAMAHTRLGQERADAGDLDGAMVHYRQAQQLDPDYAPSHVGLGLAFERQGNWAQAVAEYREAVRRDPALAAAHNNLAIALENIGLPDEAMTHYFEAVRVAPGDVRPRMNLGAALAGRGRLEEAAEQFRGALESAPFLPEAHMALGEVLERLGQRPDAVAAYRAALRERPGWPAAANALAWILATADEADLRDPSEAVRLAAEAVAASGGNDAFLLRTLAVANAAAGNLAEAKAVATRGVDVARAAGQDDLARDLDARLAAFGRP